MKTVLPFAAAVLLTFSACASKNVEDTPPSSETMEEATNATDVAETTAATIDTTAYKTDSLSTDSTGTN